MDTRDAIQNRRSVRDYTDLPVDKEAIHFLLDAAVQAPSAVNHQPWAFAIIQGKALLKSYSDRGKILFTQTMGPLSSEPKIQTLFADPAFNLFYNAGTLIVVCAKPIGQHPDWDCCLAAQNLMVAAYSMGLGTCPIGLAWPLFNDAEVKKELSIPKEFVPVLPIIVGYPKQHPATVTKNPPEILCWKQ